MASHPFVSVPWFYFLNNRHSFSSHTCKVYYKCFVPHVPSTLNLWCDSSCRHTALSKFPIWEHLTLGLGHERVPEPADTVPGFKLQVHWCAVGVYQRVGVYTWLIAPQRDKSSSLSQADYDTWEGRGEDSVDVRSSDWGFFVLMSYLSTPNAIICVYFSVLLCTYLLFMSSNRVNTGEHSNNNVHKWIMMIK